MKPSTHQTTEGTLLWADEQGLVWSHQTNPANGLTRQYFVLASEAQDDDHEDCNTHVVDALPHIDDYQLIPY